MRYRPLPSIALIVLFISALGCASAPAQHPPDPVFEAQTVDDDVAIGYGLAIGDVDGDGDPDVLLADKTQIVWYRNGDWQRFVIAEHLTERDNVCITARDINGDGRVEVAVGAQWNPGETSDPDASGSIHYLIRPSDPTQMWEAVTLPNEPTVHRMHWAQMDDGTYALVVLPLHGRGNQGGEGDGVRILAYLMPDDPHDVWETVLLDESLNMTHNFDLRSLGDRDRVYVGGRQGAVTIEPRGGMLMAHSAEWIEGVGVDEGIGEIRYGRFGDADLVTTIEPLHGNSVNVYLLGEEVQRHVLADDFNQGHGLAAADLLGLGRDQVVAGWRDPNEAERVGIRLFVPVDASGTNWDEHVLDDNTMAVEDLKVADLDGDGRLDVVAAGRDTHNLIIYWNRTDM